MKVFLDEMTIDISGLGVKPIALPKVGEPYAIS